MLVSTPKLATYLFLVLYECVSLWTPLIRRNQAPKDILNTESTLPGTVVILTFFFSPPYVTKF